MSVAVVVAVFAAVIVVSTVGFVAFAAALPLAAFAAHIAATEAMITDDTLTTDMGMRVGSKGYTGVPFTSATEAVGITGVRPTAPLPKRRSLGVRICPASKLAATTSFSATTFNTGTVSVTGSSGSGACVLASRSRSMLSAICRPSLSACPWLNSTPSQYSRQGWLPPSGTFRRV